MRNQLAIFVLVAAALQTPLAAQGPAFDVASVKPNNTGDHATFATFPLGPGTVYHANGGHFSATNYPLWIYILFAYKLRGAQAQSLYDQMPGWVTTEHFDITARTDGDPAKDTKDQMRLMMRALLADRFKLAIHSETRQVPVLALVPMKPGKFGPLLQPHPDDGSCATTPPPREDQMAGQFPALCGGILPMPHDASHTRFGARNVTMEFIANALTETGALDRTVVAATGLRGTFDFALQYARDAETQTGPTLLEAIKEQLGLKLELQKGAVEFLSLDHVEHPSEN